MYHGGVHDSSRSRSQMLGIELDSEAERAVRLRVAEVVRELVDLVTMTSPIYEMHRGERLPQAPETVDQALELVRAAALVDRELRRGVSLAHFGWAADVTLRGGQLQDVAHASMVTPSAVSRRWPRLSRLRSIHQWFCDSNNADAWARACLALDEVSNELQGCSEGHTNGDAAVLSYEVVRIVQCARRYLQARTSEAEAPVLTLLEWFELVTITPGTVQALVDPRLATGTTPASVAALQRLSAVWRAYRTGAEVDDQN